MVNEANNWHRAQSGGESEAELENEIAYCKDMLLEHDRSLSERISRGEKPSLEEKRARSRIIRQLNRARRLLYRMRRGAEQDPLRRVSFRVTHSEYARLQALAEQEGLSVSAYIRKQLFPEG